MPTILLMAVSSAIREDPKVKIREYRSDLWRCPSICLLTMTRW